MSKQASNNGTIITVLHVFYFIFYFIYFTVLIISHIQSSIFRVRILHNPHRHHSVFMIKFAKTKLMACI